MAVAKTSYREQAHIYFRQAQEELEKGDLRQASEKGWGAASQMVKALAVRKGLRHNGHALLVSVVSGLNNHKLYDEFGLAQALHMNFYEGWLDQTLVTRYLESVGSFIRTLDETELS